MDPLSNEKRAPSCLGYIGDEILHSYMGIIINHYKSSLLNNQYIMAPDSVEVSLLPSIIGIILPSIGIGIIISH